MDTIFIEENGIYSINCTNAVWATDEIHADYQQAGVHINDVDFIIEDVNNILMVEYKNANIEGAANPTSFNPEADKKITNVTRKFYDSLHYLTLLGKTKPVQYVYVLECPNSDSVMRKRLRNKLKTELPFVLQSKIGNGRKLIEKVEVLSIVEWNEDGDYRKYPIIPVQSEMR